MSTLLCPAVDPTHEAVTCGRDATVLEVDARTGEIDVWCEAHMPAPEVGVTLVRTGGPLHSTAFFLR